jgi:DnaJ-related protein SCJ1
MCGGKGKIVTQKCHVCNEDKITTGTDFLVVVIEKGMADGHVYDYSQAGDEYLNVDPSDIKVKVTTLPHAQFEREGDDLKTTVRLSLKDVS